MKKKRSWPALAAVLFVFLFLSGSAHVSGDAATAPPEEALHAALQRAREAGSYRVEIALDQSVTPESTQSFAAPAESAHFELDGAVGGPGRARFAIAASRTSFVLAQRDPQEFLINDATIYQRAGERWIQVDSAPSLVTIDGDALSLASVAREVTRLEPVENDDLGRRLDRLAFNLYADDIVRFVLLQRDQFSVENMALARLNTPDIHGSGELWIDSTGLPARLVLNLGWTEGDATPHHVGVASSADYFGFGRTFPPEHFNPAASPQTGVLGPQPATQAGLQPLVWFSVVAGLLVWGWLLVRARRNRRAMAILTGVLIAALLAPTLVPVVEAAGVRPQSDGGVDASAEAPLPGSELRQLLEESQVLASEHQASNGNPANALADMDDEDGDGLPNGYELQLGTNPFSEDTDRDGLRDDEEVNGVPCTWEPLPGQPQTVEIETDPLNPDSNYDGLNDGEEYWRGQCSDGHYRYGYAWDDDNDGDGVPDGIDLSPFSSSRDQVSKLGGREQPGSNLTFETLDQDPNPSRTLAYPFYVEIQVRPTDANALRWAYKTLTWPLDQKASIRHDPAGGALAALFTGKDHISTGEIQLVPSLQATLLERDLPSPTAREQYGVSIAPHTNDEGDSVTENGEALYDMVLPLVPVERGGQVFAFQAKMLHDRARNTTLVRRWRDLRLKWAVIGDVLMPDDDGDYVASPDGGYGLVVYDEPYQITGLQVSRQGGASMLLAGAIVPTNARVFDLDARVSLLRGGLEAQFLTGRLGLSDIKDRFDTPNSATNDERWGIPQSWEYRVLHDGTMNYAHVDEALATTTMTTTRQLLNTLYREYHGLEPTLVLASEQRTSTVNLDDDPTTNYLDIAINTCLKPLITSRSLKLQTYRWDPTASPTLSGQAATDATDQVAVVAAAPLSASALGDWVPLSLDEILQALEDQFTNLLSPEELNILKMATTAWHVGMTAIQSIGELDIQDVSNVLSDPEMVLQFLDENGLIPTEYKKVVDVLLDVYAAGGPEAWLEKQWNKVMGVVDTVGEILDGSFFDFSGEFSLPSEETLLGWTNTAINALNFLAMVTGNSFFAQVAQILTKIIEVYQKLRALWDSVKAAIDAAQRGAEAAINTLAQELGALSRPMSLVGLIIAIGMIWVALGLTLQMGDFGPTITFTLVLRAIVETILLVVLFVIATIFPWGTIVAIGIGLIKFIEGLIGFHFDPVSAFLDWLFAVEAVQRTDIDGQPQIGQLKMEALEPGGGSVAGRLFRLKLPSILTMKTVNGGDAGDLNASWSELHLGRFQAAVNVPVSICTRSTDQFQDYKDALQGFIKQEFSAQNYYCVAFTLPREKYWLFSASGAYTAGDPYVAPPGVYKRDFLNVGYLDIEPLAAINGKVFLDVSYDLWVRYDECSKFGCDEYIADSTTAPAVEPMYFDILPGSLKSLWEWEDLFNPDPDGDGLTGYVDPATQQPVGPDANLCPALPGPKSWERWDRDSDGLSDKFELETAGFDPCIKDTDGDGVEDGRELLIGTSPDLTDTDGDGLTDKQEIVLDNGFILTFPWRVKLDDQYPGLPNPVAFSNPRQANIDQDHRNDKKEKSKQTSPNAFNPIPVGEPLDLWINQALTSGGGTNVTISTPPWVNDEAVAASPMLSVTLPVPFSNLTRNAELLPSVAWPAFNQGTLQPSGNPDQNVWSLPIIWLDRTMQATLAGTPAVPNSPVSITVQLSYIEGGTPQVATATAPLKVNAGGPSTSFTGVVGAVPLSGLEQTGVSEPPVTSGPVTIQGMATDPEGVSAVYVCVKSSDTCGLGDWDLASSTVGVLATPAWSYDFNPAADAVYYVRAYAVDKYQVTGPVSDPITIGIDRTPPAGADFDLESTAFVSTTAGLGALSIISVTGRVSDTTGAAYVSGVGSLSLLDEDGQLLDTLDPAQPGQPTSPFTYGWQVPSGGFGGPDVKPSEFHTLTVGVRDVAGNTSGPADTLRILVDDTPPAVFSRPPQTYEGTTLTLSGLADDTALLDRRRANRPYATGMTMEDRDTRFDATAPGGKALIVGDLTGDLIDDVVLLVPPSPFAGTPFQAGLFFGRPDGFPDTRALSDADVIFRGELPAALFDFDPAAAGAGDVNGDGIGDLLLGDPSADSGAGRAYLVLGRRDFGSGATFDLANADWKLSVAGTTGFGGSVSGAGDVNGDGLADLMVGAANDGVQDSAIWLYTGREQGVPSAIAQFYTAAPAGFFPPNLAGLGDTDGDGLSDLLIAPEGADVALVLGRPDDAWAAGATDLSGLAAAGFSAPGPWQTVARAGDVNGDGLQDMLIGDPEINPPHVFLVYGRRPENPWPAGASLALVRDADASFVETTDTNSHLGAALTTLGDIDYDGRDDFAFGQPGTTPEVDRTAIVATDRTGLALDMPVSAATVIISGTSTIPASGAYLSSGDVNGDHIPDLLIGAGGDNRAYLFNGAFEPGAVSGIASVQIGLFGPVADATMPLTATLPAAWRPATLANPDGPVSPWVGQLVIPGDGDYRVYARARDRAGNQLPATNWYLGNLWANSAPAPLSGANATLQPPSLTDQTTLGLTGTLTNGSRFQGHRVYDGYAWHRMPPVTGSWFLDAAIPRSDLRSLTVRSVARDATGGTVTVSRTLTVDTLVAQGPQLSANLPPGQWQTDISPNLVLSWTVPTDASGINGTWAVIDTISDTLPTTPAGGTQVTRDLTDPGIYYGHVRVQDGAGNDYTAHSGPFPVNRSQTPSVILADGYLDFAGGEYPDGTLLNYDPYALFKPAALWGTWDASKLYLGYPGNQWGADSFLSIYMDTQSGGLATSLALSQTHTLPFAADYAFVLGGDTAPYTLYAAGASTWQPVASPQSRAVTRLHTEIVLDRAEIGANGAVGLLAFVEGANGVQAALPAGARPTMTETIAGPVVFGNNLSWSALATGVKPGDGQEQAIAPLVSIKTARDNTLVSGETAVFTVTVTNPDIAPYQDEPLTVRAEPEMVLTGASGAACISCPAGGNEWTLAANVDAGATQTMTLQAKALGSAVNGVVPISVTAHLEDSGLPSDPQAPARALYSLDRGAAAIRFLKPGRSLYVKPGQVDLSLLADLDLSTIRRCLNQVEANVGSGWQVACSFGDCTQISGSIQAGTSLVWQARVAGENGRVSEPISKTLIADSTAPVAEISPTLVLSGNLAFIQGVTWDTFPDSRAPQRVEISIDGARFRRAFVSATGNQIASASGGASTTAWRFPLQLSGFDGEAVQVVARAIDEAGNVGASSEPATITLDGVGPSITGAPNDTLLQGTASDGSGVASVEVSLDGGASYRSATLADESWSYDMARWVGGARQSFAVVRARDIWGNVAHAFIVVESSTGSLVYLPFVRRN